MISYELRMSRILVIDDDALVTQLLQDFLSSEGHDVTVVRSGNEGWEKAKEIRPDLVIQDVMLPDATGFQMVKRFRENPETATMPIIMMSGAARHPNQQLLGSMMGADDYLLKPFNIDILQEKIHRLLKLPHQPRAVEEPPVLSLAPESLVRSIQSERASIHLKDVVMSQRPEQTLFPLLSNAPKLDGDERGTVPALSLPSTSHFQTWRLSAILSASFMMFLLVGFMIFEGPDQALELLRAVGTVMGAWAMLTGFLAVFADVVHISVAARVAVRITGLAMVPLLMKIVLLMVNPEPGSRYTLMQALWMKPLDSFMLTSLLIVGLQLKRRPGGSFGKSLGAMVVLAIMWLIVLKSYTYS